MIRFLVRTFSCFALLLLPAAVGAQIAGGMLVCDGVSDYGVIPDDQEDFVFSTALTVEAWIRPETFRTSTAAVLGADSAFNLTMTTGAKPGFTVSVPSTNTAFGPTSMVAGAWTHLAGTFDGTKSGST